MAVKIIGDDTYATGGYTLNGALFSSLRLTPTGVVGGDRAAADEVVSKGEDG